LGEKGFREIFDRVVGIARQNGLVKDRLRIKDATHVIADIHIPTTLALVAQTRDKLLDALELVRREEAAHGNDIEALSIDGIGYNGPVLRELEDPGGLAIDTTVPPKAKPDSETFGPEKFVDDPATGGLCSHRCEMERITHVARDDECAALSGSTVPRCKRPRLESRLQAALSLRLKPGLQLGTAGASKRKRLFRGQSHPHRVRQAVQTLRTMPGARPAAKESQFR
jgi:hypothetical protein